LLVKPGRPGSGATELDEDTARSGGKRADPRVRSGAGSFTSHL
jgi:hypothetical protein